MFDLMTFLEGVLTLVIYLSLYVGLLWVASNLE